MELSSKKLAERVARIVSGFREIEAFAKQHDREPVDSKDSDWSERTHAVRLSVMREKQECRDAIAPIDTNNLLGEAPQHKADDVESLLHDKKALAYLGEQMKREPKVEARKRISLSL